MLFLLLFGLRPPLPYNRKTWTSFFQTLVVSSVFFRDLNNLCCRTRLAASAAGRSVWLLYEALFFIRNVSLKYSGFFLRFKISNS